MSAIDAPTATAPTECVARRWNDAAAVAFILLSVSLIYGARLNLLPLVGEETRWATGAREMLDSGDWIVPRQQGQVFPERPPMTMWGMAVVGSLRGSVDPIAVRLPSVIAVVLTSLLIYMYARVLLSQTAAIGAALIYATFGQVLQIGRLGESEAAFALFVSASLLVWHLGYVRGWPRLAVWSSGFAFAALAALVKGPQAPVYFVAITTVYLIVQRDWRYLFCWQSVAGAGVFVAIIATWQLPFYRATDWSSVIATWAGLAGDRIRLSGVLSHAISYPVETFVCLLPWSPLLFVLVRRGTRDLLADKQPIVTYLLVAIIVAYPTVWLAAGARGRYFMPLYPLVAVLIGFLIERCSTAKLGTSQRRAWNLFLVLWAIAIGAGGLVLGIAGLLPGDLAKSLHQPRSFCLMFAAIAASAAYILSVAFRRPTRFAPLSAVLATVTIAGFGVGGILMNVNESRWNDPTSEVEYVRSRIPADTTLFSLTEIEHRFAYYYHTPVVELPWPQSVSDMPADVEYFCFMRHGKDTADSRMAGRGRIIYYTSGRLPFAWEELAEVCVDRQPDAKFPAYVVLGRVLRPLRAELSDATKPRGTTARKPSLSQRK